MDVVFARSRECEGLPYRISPPANVSSPDTHRHSPRSTYEWYEVLKAKKIPLGGNALWAAKLMNACAEGVDLRYREGFAEGERRDYPEIAFVRGTSVDKYFTLIKPTFNAVLVSAAGLKRLAAMDLWSRTTGHTTSGEPTHTSYLEDYMRWAGYEEADHLAFYAGRAGIARPGQSADGGVGEYLAQSVEYQALLRIARKMVNEREDPVMRWSYIRMLREARAARKQGVASLQS